MNTQIRHVGYFLALLFVMLFIQVNNIQVLQADKLASDPRNNRNAVRDFSSPRGVIQTADGVVIAKSVPVDDEYKQLRTYPKGSLYGHITGFFSFTFGNEALERQYNKDLTGKTYALSNIDDLLTDRVRANNVTITVEDKLQETARSALGDKRGAVVALNPKTGAVLAMYSNPSYDPSPLSAHDFQAVKKTRASLLKTPGNPLLPRAYQESYPPGSTSKVITAASAFEQQPALTKKRYPFNQSITPPRTDRPIRNFGGATCGGTLPELMRVSCNTGFAQMGLDLGSQNLSTTANAFGFNKTPPLDMPFVAKSRFPAEQDLRRNPPFLAFAAIGQGNVSSTPLQMALVAAGIANKGVIMQPHFLKEVRNPRGEIVRTARSEPWLRATSSGTAEEVTKLMQSVVSSGTAKAAAVQGVKVAAKTGTAQTTDDLIHAWLISFAPADDPKIAVAVVVENQEGVSEATGGRIAAPIAQQVMKAALDGATVK